MNARTAKDYVARIHYPQKATLFVTYQSQTRIPRLAEGWKAVARTVDIHDVPGCHGVISPESLLKEPNVKTLAKTLQATIAQALRKG